MDRGGSSSNSGGGSGQRRSVRSTGDGIPTQLWNLSQDQDNNYQPRELENPSWLGVDYQLKPADVICGNRGAPGEREEQHPGNNRFKVVIQLMVDRYLQAERKSEKTAVVREVVDMVRQSGGRFVKRGSNGGWHDAGNIKAREKASTAIRSLAAKKRGGASQETTTDLVDDAGSEQPSSPEASPSHSSRGRKRARVDSTASGLSVEAATEATTKSLTGPPASEVAALRTEKLSASYPELEPQSESVLPRPSAAQSSSPIVQGVPSRQTEFSSQLADVSGSLSNDLASNINFPMPPDLFSQLMSSFSQSTMAGSNEPSSGRREEFAAQFVGHPPPPQQPGSTAPGGGAVDKQTEEGPEDRKPPAK